MELKIEVIKEKSFFFLFTHPLPSLFLEQGCMSESDLASCPSDCRRARILVVAIVATVYLTSSMFITVLLG